LPSEEPEGPDDITTAIVQDPAKRPRIIGPPVQGSAGSHLYASRKIDVDQQMSEILTTSKPIGNQKSAPQYILSAQLSTCRGKLAKAEQRTVELTESIKEGEKREAALKDQLKTMAVAVSTFASSRSTSETMLGQPHS
jgi:hypothetical protein